MEKKKKVIRILTCVFAIIGVTCAMLVAGLYLYAGPQTFIELYSIVEVKATIMALFIGQTVGAVAVIVLVIISAILDKKTKISRFKKSHVTPKKFMGELKEKE